MIETVAPEVVCKKAVLRNLTKFTIKNLCQSLFSNKVVGLGLNFIKKEALAQMFSWKFCEISLYRTPPVAASDMKYFLSSLYRITHAYD